MAGNVTNNNYIILLIIIMIIKTQNMFIDDHSTAFTY